MNTKKCIKCGIRLHPTDWILLKDMATLPICDNCSLYKENNNYGLEKQYDNTRSEKKIITFPTNKL